MATDKQPTEFGYELLKLMGTAGLRPAGLARAANTSGSTITRLIYGGVERPDSNTLHRIARALIEATSPPGLPSAEAEEAVNELHNNLLHAAGYRIGAAPPPAPVHRLAVELNQMIGAGTPLTAEEVKFLEFMADQLMEPYRAKLRKRAS
ncbi:hypothetical protein GCM10010170_033240 [Dactylosporangium salmoneum]|uniref:HTH cro/C1-type domain-containing protein n=1 Tax=Dactylosporangium salmoneum TaxID=53361 RepID=A0ABN3G8H8_9ACTN